MSAPGYWSGVSAVLTNGDTTITFSSLKIPVEDTAWLKSVIGQVLPDLSGSAMFLVNGQTGISLSRQITQAELTSVLAVVSLGPIAYTNPTSA